MSNPGEADPTPIRPVKRLADWFLRPQPGGAFRIGTEHEKFGFRLGDLAHAAL